MLFERLICLIVGYICGCFLTADFVAHAQSGHSARELGSHNPGMANIASLFGTKWAALVLVGDILKTVIACELARWIFASDLGQLAVLWAGVGCVLGHNFPAHTGFCGGKGVTVSCATIVLFDPVYGFVAMIIGLVVVLFAKQLCLGAVSIIAVYCIVEGIRLGLCEAFFLCLVLFVLMLVAHGHTCVRAFRGQEPEIDLLKRLHSL